MNWKVYNSLCTSKSVVNPKYKHIIYTRHTMFSKILKTLALIFCLADMADAQTYYQVTVVNGSQVVNGITVTTTAINGAGTYGAYCGAAGPYWIGNGNTVASAYNYVFSSPVRKIRMHMTATGYLETMSSQINGSGYNYTTANISAFAGTCNCPNVYTVISGNLINNTSTVSNAGAIIDIDPGYAIDSFLITHLGSNDAGTVYDFYFAIGCVGSIVATATYDTVCVGDSLHLFTNTTSVSSSATYSWAGPNGFTSSSKNPVIISVSALDSGTYTVTASDTGTCTYTSSIHITVNTAPSLTTSSNGPLCPDDTLHLSVNTISGANYHWTGPNSYSSNTQNPSVQPFLAADSGNYIVTETINGCHSSDSIHVSVKPLPAAPTVGSNSPICFGANLNLTTSSTTSGVTYQWTGPNSFSTTTQDPTVSSVVFADSGNYIVKTILNGCKVADTIHVTVKPLPATPAITNNSPVCVGDTIKITSNSTTSSVSYSWTGPNSFSSASQNITISNTVFADSGNYYLSLSLNACSISDTVHVSISPLPAAPTASNNSPLCAGASLNLSASSTTSGVTYQWTGPNGFSSTSQNPVINPVVLADSGNYIVKAILNGCKAADTTHVTVSPAPAAPAITNNSPLCAGDTLKITSNSTTSGVSYSWTGPNSFSSASQNITIDNTVLADSGKYYLSLSLNGCSIFDTVHVTISSLPATPSASNNSPLCAGTSLNLSASSTTPGITYQWTGPNGFSSTSQNPVINPVALADSGNYIVKAVLNGCNASDTTHVTVKPLPAAPVITNNSPICAGDTLKITSNSATSGVSYSWTGPNSFSSGSQNITIANSTTSNSGTYNLTVSLNGCSVYATATAVVNIVPAKPTIGSNSPVCTTTSLNLNSSSTTPGVTYQWTGPSSFFTTTQNPSVNPVTMADSGNYIVKAILSGCSSADTTHVTVTLGPDSITFNSNSPVCTGNSLTITSTASSGVNFSWTGPNSFSSLSADFSITNTTVANGGDYYLTLSKNGCIVHDTLPTIVNQTPAIPNVGSNSAVCVGSNLDLTSSTTTNGVTYSWSGPNSFSSAAQNPVISNAALANSGNYIITVTRTGCSSKDSTQVTVITNPAIPLAGSNSPVCAGDSLKLNATDNTMGVSYQWTGPGSYTSLLQNPSVPNILAAGAGTYTVIASLNGCSSQASTSVTVYPVLGPPHISISASPGDSICSGTTITFTATPANAGSPQYQWNVNGTAVSGATGSTYITASLNSGDIVTCTVTSNSPCQAVNTALSNAIRMHIGSVPAPLITISVYPSVYTPGDYVTFTANPAGNTPGLSFQWQKNGVDVSGAQSAVFTTSDVSLGDTICVVVSNTIIPCAIPAVVCIGLTTAVGNITANNKLEVYPNPNAGSFTISGEVNTEKANITLVNTLGQEIYNKEVLTPGGVLNAQVDLVVPDGIYILRIISGTAIKTMPLTFKR